MAGTKPAFKRQESWRYKRVAENWRRPRGVTSKMRKEESGWPRKVKVGYGTSNARRGLHPRGLVDRLVYREADLEKLDPKLHIVRIAGSVGGKKRVGILDRANQLNFHIVNPGRRETTPLPSEETPTIEETGRGKKSRRSPTRSAEVKELEEKPITEVEVEKPIVDKEGAMVDEEEEEPVMAKDETSAEEEE
jgi:large subunit ribosomal protein L32e